MLKNLLKTSVSALVLMGALSSFDPTYAGNGGGKMKQEDDDQPHSNKKKTKSKKENLETNKIIAKPKDSIDWILTPFIEEDFSFPKAIEFKSPAIIDKNHCFYKLPKYVRSLIFSFLDAKSMLQSELVCKSWYPIIHEYCGAPFGLDRI